MTPEPSTRSMKNHWGDLEIEVDLPEVRVRVSGEESEAATKRLRLWVHAALSESFLDDALKRLDHDFSPGLKQAREDRTRRAWEPLDEADDRKRERGHFRERRR